ncbi:immunity 52 family protein [Myxococcaceae bacterium GXIMD 01537]
MMGTYYAGSYWLARHESAEACARRAELFFRLLGHCDPAWNGWHDTDGSRASHEALVSPDAATFTRMFKKKKYQDGPDGFRFWFWVGNTVPEATSVNARCGSANPWVSSACVLMPPDDGHISERVLTTPVLTEVVRAMALAWEPEWAVATSHEHRDMVSKQADAGTFVGWVMYFSRQRGTVPPLPAPARIEPVEDKGTLVILTPERFTASNPEHVALAAQVHALLDKAGLLGPLRPISHAEPL